MSHNDDEVGRVPVVERLHFLKILRMNKVIVFVPVAVRVENIRQFRIGRDALPGDDIILQQLRILRVNEGAVIGGNHKPDIACAIMIHALAAHSEIAAACEISAGIIPDIPCVFVR